MPTAVLIDYIDQHRDRFGVEPICAVLTEAGVKIAPSTYYAAKTSPAPARSVGNAELVADVKVAQRASSGSTAPGRSMPISTGEEQTPASKSGNKQEVTNDLGQVPGSGVALRVPSWCFRR